MPESFIKSFTHLKDRPKPDRALPMLQRIGSLVKPIMRKHGWNLPVLAEFFPESPNLLGESQYVRYRSFFLEMLIVTFQFGDVNQGEKICLRLRPAHAPDTFIDEESVVQTMLHELTHNVHGPHDEKFYKFLSKLQDEYEELQSSGYAGEGFFSKGQRVGVGVSHDLPPHLARQKALEAAEKRRQTTRILGGGGRLGGRLISTTGLSPRELAARAAERRAHDEVACGSGELAEREAAKAAKDSIENKVIDLTMDDGGSDGDDVIVIDQTPAVGPSKMTALRSKPGTPPTSIHDRAPPNQSEPAKANGVDYAPVDRTVTSLPPKASPEWSCPMCTLLNPPQALQCDACLSERPLDPSAGWTCFTCGEAGIPRDFWSCRICGAIKTTS